MAKKINLQESIFKLTKDFPELIEIMADLGFSEITKKPLLHSVGKLMNIPKGAKMKKIPMADIVTALTENGFELEGKMPRIDFTEAKKDRVLQTENSESRKAVLITYLKRLGNGENLESVRADFVKNFSTVEASEIMEAERELLKEGTPLTEVQRLCDLHSALFHGATSAEKIARDGAMPQTIFPQKDYTAKNAQAAALARIPGHPLSLFTKENEALADLLKEYRASHADMLFDAIRELSIHYAKKGDLLYPNLKVQYGISGPSDVMWTVDDEIRDELKNLAAETERNEQRETRINTVLNRAEEMIYKEQNILFPICAANFTEEEWFGIYRDSKDYASCFGVAREIWEEAENRQAKNAADVADKISMPGGHLTLEELTAVLNTIPLEISFIDADNINRFFNEGHKVFKRPAMALDRDVFSCHPPKIEPMVRAIINDFRNGTRNSVPVWMEKGGKTMLVTYMAVRDKSKKYLGTLEIVQDMEAVKAHFEK